MRWGNTGRDMVLARTVGMNRVIAYFDAHTGRSIRAGAVTFPLTYELCMYILPRIKGQGSNHLVFGKLIESHRCNAADRQSGYGIG